ncbi:MAG TPA: hypothetical protein PKL97_05025 [Candidatus Omnitrophota bacterium]|nr:hypothetical protein [Candidatus Omnitrophota bacterium]
MRFETFPKRIQQKVGPILVKAVIAFAGLALIAGALPFFFNQLAWMKLKRNFPLEFQGDLRLGRWGMIEARNALLKRDTSFEIRAKEIKVVYSLPAFLVRQDLVMNIEGTGLRIGFSEGEVPGGGSFSSHLDFDSLQASLATAGRGKTEIRHFAIEGPALIGYAEGCFHKKDRLDFDVACFLRKEFISGLPRFFSEHLFDDREGPFKEVRFGVHGSWDEPSLSFSSDLIRIEVKSRDNG